MGPDRIKCCQLRAESNRNTISLENRDHSNLRLVKKLCPESGCFGFSSQREVLRRLRLVANDRQEGVLVEVMALEWQDDVATLGTLLQRFLQVGQQVAEDFAIRFRDGDVGIKLS